jgi:hypothetical protein
LRVPRHRLPGRAARRYTAASAREGLHAACGDSARQKKPRLRGVSVACLCGGASSSRCYPVVRSVSGDLLLFRTRRFFVCSWRSLTFPMRLSPLIGRHEQHSCQGGGLLYRCDMLCRAGGANVMHRALRAAFRGSGAQGCYGTSSLSPPKNTANVKILDAFHREAAVAGTPRVSQTIEL